MTYAELHAKSDAGTRYRLEERAGINEDSGLSRVGAEIRTVTEHNKTNTKQRFEQMRFEAGLV